MKYDIDGHLHWAPTRKMFGGWICHKDSPSAPTPPDPYSTATAQTQSNQQTAAYNAGLNRVNQNSPYGNLTYSHTAQPGAFDQAGYDAAMQKYNTDGSGGTAPDRASFTSAAGPDQWTANMTLSPQQQALLNQSTNTGYLRGTIAGDETAHAQNLFSAPVDFSGSPALATGASYGGIQNDLDTSKVPDLIGGDRLASDLGQTRDSIYRQQAAYLDPQWNQREHDLQNQLTQQGVMQNSDAWNRAVDDMGRQRSFDYNQARDSAIQGGGQEQSRLFGLGLASNQNAFGQSLAKGQFHNQAQAQGFGQSMANAQLQNAARMQANNELMSQRNQTMSEINQNAAAGQATNPQFSNVPSANMSGTDIAGLIGQNYANQMGGYNSQVAQNNAMTNGLFGLGGAYLLSDIRAKQNIVKLSERPDGIGVYEFEYRPQFRAEWGAGRYVGVLAQEVERIRPDAVKTRPDGYRTVNYGML